MRHYAAVLSQTDNSLLPQNWRANNWPVPPTQNYETAAWSIFKAKINILLY